MPYSFDESKRIKALRRDLIAAVPRFPNDKNSLQAMEAKSLTNLLITFIAWRLRHVGTRARIVTGRNNLANDPRASGLAPNIDAFLKLVEDGGFGRFGVSLSSHPVAIVRAAQEHVRILLEIDPDLENLTYVRSLYPEGSVPAKPKLKWAYNHLDFGLWDEGAAFRGVFSYGPN